MTREAMTREAMTQGAAAQGEPTRDTATRRPVKRSLTLAGHRTSVSLEEGFWTAFREIAAERGRTVQALATEIDRARGVETGLATAIRLFVLEEYRSRLGLPPTDRGG
jgi:predicted DNA-binding ribbon-helix-helix protein